MDPDAFESLDNKLFFLQETSFQNKRSEENSFLEELEDLIATYGQYRAEVLWNKKSDMKPFGNVFRHKEKLEPFFRKMGIEFCDATTPLEKIDSQIDEINQQSRDFELKKFGFAYKRQNCDS